MSNEAAAVEDAKDAAAAPPAWVGELTPTQRREVKGCLPFPLKALEGGTGYAWLSEHAGMTASVKFGEDKNSLVISVFDADAEEEIEMWRAELRMTGHWKRRLRQLSGEALVLCQ